MWMAKVWPWRLLSHISHISNPPGMYQVIERIPITSGHSLEITGGFPASSCFSLVWMREGVAQKTSCSLLGGTWCRSVHTSSQDACFCMEKSRQRGPSPSFLDCPLPSDPCWPSFDLRLLLDMGTSCFVTAPHP